MREWLVRLRKIKNLTQKEIAAKSYIDRSYYSQIESGKRNPSISVAKTIASALDFNPSMFWDDNLHEYDTTVLEVKNFDKDLKIIEVYRNLNNSQILYISSNRDYYIQQIILFFQIGIEKNAYCYLFDTPENLLYIEKQLKDYFSKNQMKLFSFIIKEEYDPFKSSNKYIHTLLNEKEHTSQVFIWFRFENLIHGHDPVTQMNDCTSIEYSVLKNLSIIFIGAYDASLITAGTHINLMRCYPYLMTDFEIINSPLFFSGKTKILPTLYIQEHL